MDSKGKQRGRKQKKMLREIMSEKCLNLKGTQRCEKLNEPPSIRNVEKWH